nr:immunoglobulin light chain junction region [Macaca mulatta]
DFYCYSGNDKNGLF